jgi:hypothetical protein
MRSLLAALILAAATLAAGCGGDNGSAGGTVGGTETSATPAGDWASGVCEAFSSWESAITSAGDSVRQNPTEEGLRTATDEIRSATEALRDDLRGLGRPDTDSGEQAKETTDELATNLDANQQKITEAMDNVDTSGVVVAASTIGTTLVAMGNDVSTAFQQLDQLDAQGELQDAFNQADSCTGLTTTS